jgi:preprotein translocase subunit YajC
MFMCDKTSCMIKKKLIATLEMKMNKRMKQIQSFNNELDKGIKIFTNNIHVKINRFWDETY